MGGGSAPDVVWEQYGPVTSGALPAGLLQNIKPYLEKPNPYMSGGSSWLSTFTPSTIPYMTSPNGDIDIILGSNVETGFYYSKAAFAKAGIASPPRYLGRPHDRPRQVEVGRHHAADVHRRRVVQPVLVRAPGHVLAARESDSAGFTGKYGVFPEPPITSATTPLGLGTSTVGVIGGPNGNGQWSITSQRADTTMTPAKTATVMNFVAWLFTPQHLGNWLKISGSGSYIPTVTGAPTVNLPGLESLVPAGKVPTVVDVVLDDVLSAAATNSGMRLVQEYINGPLSYSAFASQWQSLLTSSAQAWATQNHVDQIPGELLESARIDGCTEPQVLRRVVVPLTRPVLLTGAILVTINVWGDYLWVTIVIQDPHKVTISAGVQQFVSSFGLNVSSGGSVFAAFVIATVPMFVLVGFTMRYFVSGLTQGATKL